MLTFIESTFWILLGFAIGARFSRRIYLSQIAYYEYKSIYWYRRYLSYIRVVDSIQGSDNPIEKEDT
jgi:hypothetical protein